MTLMLLMIMLVLFNSNDIDTVDLDPLHNYDFDAVDDDIGAQ